MVWKDKELWLNLLCLDDGRVVSEKVQYARRCEQLSWDTGPWENIKCKSIHHSRLGSYVSQSHQWVHQYVFFLFQSHKSHLRYDTSTHILHIIFVFIPHLSFMSTTLPLSQNTLLSYSFPFLHALIMSWHRVQHTPSTAYSECSIFQQYHPPKMNCLSIDSQKDELTLEGRFGLQSASLRIDCQQPSTTWVLNCIVTTSHSHCLKLFNQWIVSQHQAFLPSTAYISTTNKNYSDLDWSWPTSTSSCSLNYSLQVYHQFQPIMNCHSQANGLPVCLQSH